MSRLLALALALAALLATAAPASAATFLVDEETDDPGNGLCDADDDNDCTLREAVAAANAAAGSDTITFAPDITTIVLTLGSLAPLTGPTVVDGGGDVVVEAGAPDADPTLTFAAGSSELKSITLRAGATATASSLLSVTGSGFSGSSVTLRDAPAAAAVLAGTGGSLGGSTVTGADGTGVVLAGGGTTLSGSSVSGSGGSGVLVSGGGASVSGSAVSGSGGNGIQVSGNDSSISGSQVSGNGGAGILLAASGVRVSGGSVHRNSGAGIRVEGQNDVITQVILHANGGRPIELADGANGGIQPPQSLRIGPRRSDGSLPLTGTTSGGTLEFFSGNPFSPIAPAYAFSHGVEPGDFTYHFASEPPPGATFALTLTAGGTSEYALVSVPADIASPDIAHARAVSTTEVRLVPTEPVDGASVQAGDFRLFMAGLERPIASAAVAPDGSIALGSSGWRAGEAGYVELTAPGALADTAGNASLSTTRYRVAAAPGDFIAPIATRMRLAPKAICLTRGSRCRRAGARLSFLTTEDGKVEVVVQRGNKRVGTRTHAVKAGANTVDFDGRLRGRKLRAGRYRLLLYMTDVVGNRNPNPPITIFSVRRVTG